MNVMPSNLGMKVWAEPMKLPVLIETMQERASELDPQKVSELLWKVFWIGAQYWDGKIRIVDVTLREWDQAFGTSMNALEKKFVYLLLRELWIHVIEIGFPAWETDFNNVKSLVDFFTDDPNPPYISVLWRVKKLDTNQSIESTENAQNTRVHCFASTSDSLIIAKHCIGNIQPWTDKEPTLEEWREFIKNSIIDNISSLKKEQEKRRKDWKDFEIEFSPEDATGSNYKFLLECVKLAIKSGANIINVPDTLWTSDTITYGHLFALLYEDTQDLRQETNKNQEKKYDFQFSCHVHNDRGLATANTLMAAKACLALGDSEFNTEGCMNHAGEWAWTAGTDETILNATKAWILDERVNTRLTAIVADAIRVLTMDDPHKYRSPWTWWAIFANTSWIHDHAAGKGNGAYRNGKSNILGAETVPPFFSARGGTAWIKKLLESLWVNTNGIDLASLVAQCSKIAETTKFVDPAIILATHLKNEEQLSEITFDVDEKNIIVAFSLNGESINIYETIESWERSSIPALLRGLQKLSWDETDIKFIETHIKEKPSLSGVMKETREKIEQLWSDCKWVSEYFRNKFNEILSLSKQEEEGTTKLTSCEFEVWGERRRVINHGTDQQKATIEAIIYTYLPAILKKKWHPLLLPSM